jgi:quercetin dioxygenase-like cupin family protein
MLSWAKFSLSVALTLSLSAVADDSKPQPQRAVLERHDQADVPGKEIVIGKATLPAGTAIGFHVHPGDEAGYVLKGAVIWKTKGQPDRTLKAGDTFFNPRGAVHSVAASEASEAVVISTWIVDKGQPLATPAP